MATVRSDRKRPPEEELQAVDASQSSSTSVAFASDQAVPPPSPTSHVLPPVQSDLDPRMEEGGNGTLGDGDRFLLYRIAKQYGLEWAIPGQTSPHKGELGRPPMAQKPDQLLLSQGAAIDILSSVNNHLNIPPFNSVPPDLREIISTSRRRAQPLSSSGLQPIPMSRYSSEVSELASFLDVNPAAPVAPNFPTPVFPKAVGFSQYHVLSALEGITAVNIHIIILEY